MVIFLGAVFAVALLVLMVYALHRYQQKEKTESVDRALPLPPLEVNGNHIIADENPEDILGLSAQPTPAQSHLQPQPHSRRQASTVAAKSGHHLPAPSARTVGAANWLLESRILKDNGDLDAALELCRHAYPQAGAFKQACVVIRAMLREARKQGRNPEPLLSLLYRTAALDAYLHAKDEQLPALSPSVLRTIPNDAWVDIALPYQRLGVEQIALLNKADIRQFEESWGVPNSHMSVRRFHKEAWLHMTNNQNDTTSGD